MSETAISVEKLSKRYQIGAKRSGSFRETLTNAFRRKTTSQIEAAEFWALKDVSFEIKRGEAVGIIGKNGAGKSTLLKILSRITEPTHGRIEINGRVASLLEVGTGFHPELTGRENIFMNGTILGMTRREIKAKFDEIVDFSGVEKFIDTPVKHYSSGMYVRLAFAVAAHLEPEILIIDEVLAVGDAEFQKKCLGKMGEVAGQGRTVLFVSHNLTAVQSLCTQAILFKEGKVLEFGETQKIINSYLSKIVSNHLSSEWTTIESAPGNEYVRVKSISVIPTRTDSLKTITVETPLEVEFECWSLEPFSKLNVSLHLYQMTGELIFANASPQVQLQGDSVKFVCHIPPRFLNDGSYYISMMIVKNDRSLFFYEEALYFEVGDIKRTGAWLDKWPGIIRPTLNWDVNIQKSLDFKMY